MDAPTFITLLRWFIDDSAVLQAAQIKHADTAIRATTDEYIDTVGTESDIEDFFIVSNQLRFSRQGRDIPDGAGSVDTRGDDQAR